MNVIAADGTANRRSFRAWCSVLMLCACLCQPAAWGQESGKEWRISEPSGQSTVYNTQPEAVDAIKALPAPNGYPPEFQIGWQSVDKIKSQKVSESGDISITYWMGKAQPSDPDWSYIANAFYTSEADMRAGLFAQWQAISSAACPAVTMEPQGDWAAYFPEQEGTFEYKTFTVTSQVGDNTPDSPCTPLQAVSGACCTGFCTAWVTPAASSKSLSLI